MRRDDDVRVGEQRVVGDRLAAEDVERRAARPCRESSAAWRSSSTISGPRATLRTRTPSFIFANASALSQPSVSGVFGRWIVMKSASA